MYLLSFCLQESLGGSCDKRTLPFLPIVGDAACRTSPPAVGPFRFESASSRPRTSAGCRRVQQGAVGTGPSRSALLSALSPTRARDASALLETSVDLLERGTDTVESQRMKNTCVTAGASRLRRTSKERRDTLRATALRARTVRARPTSRPRSLNLTPSQNTQSLAAPPPFAANRGPAAPVLCGTRTPRSGRRTPGERRASARP